MTTEETTEKKPKPMLGLCQTFTLVRRKVLERDKEGNPIKFSEPIETLSWEDKV